MKRMILANSAALVLIASAGFAAEEHDRAVTAETRAEAQTRAGKLFDKLDLNHDGKLDQADRAARINRMFDTIDANHDGQISRAEFAAMHEHKMGPEHPGGMGHWGYDHREMQGLVMLILDRADPAHTGTVSRAAFVNGALALFDAADSNHDGVLTPAEQRTYARAMHRQMHEDGQHPGGPEGGMPPAGPPPPAPAN